MQWHHCRKDYRLIYHGRPRIMDFFTGGYGWFNVFLLMLVFSGMILDKMGVRFTGILAIGIMLIGGFIKYWAISGHVHGMFELSIFFMAGHFTLKIGCGGGLWFCYLWRRM